MQVWLTNSLYEFSKPESTTHWLLYNLPISCEKACGLKSCLLTPVLARRLLFQCLSYGTSSPQIWVFHHRASSWECLHWWICSCVIVIWLFTFLMREKKNTHSRIRRWFLYPQCWIPQSKKIFACIWHYFFLSVISNKYFLICTRFDFKIARKAPEDSEHVRARFIVRFQQHFPCAYQMHEKQGGR